MEENGIKQAQRLYKLCCSFGFGSVMLQFVWPVIVFWYLAFSLPKGQRVRESDTDEETQWFLSQWKCDNGKRNMTDSLWGGGHHQARVGPWGHPWARVVGRTVQRHLFECWICSRHQWGRALSVFGSCWTQIITQQLMCVDSSSRRWLLKWSNTHIYRSMSNCLC